MGQRLNIEIKKGDKTLANAYYHWSAYSSSACGMAVDIMNFMKENPQSCDDVLYAIRLLEHTGAGLTHFNPSEEEKEQAKNLYKSEYYEKWLARPSERKTAMDMFPNEVFKNCYGRNEGLLAITEYGINETRDWEEGRVTIDIGEQRVGFDVYRDASAFDDAESEEEETLNLELSYLSYEDLLKLQEILDDYAKCRYFKTYKLPDGRIIAFIE